MSVPQGQGLPPRYRIHALYSSSGEMTSPAPVVGGMQTLPTGAAGSDIIPKPGLGQGAGGGQEAAALTGLPDLL